MSYASPAGSSGLRNGELKQRLRGRSIDYAAEDAQAQRELDQLFALADSGGSATPPRAPAAAKAAAAAPRLDVPVTYLEGISGGSAMKAIPVLQLDPRVLEHLDELEGTPALERLLEDKDFILRMMKGYRSADREIKRRRTM